MEQNRLLLIINPKSGVSSKEGMGPMLSSRLEAMGFNVDVAYTQAKGHATQLANRAVAEGYGSVAVCGGDGTVNETAKALAGSGVAMGIIPSGSGNGLARHLDIPIDEALSADIIGKRQMMDCDCGVANGRLFFCTMGYGFDASVSHRFANEKRRGRITYIKNVVEEFGHYQPQPYRITVDGETREEEAFVVACCNASQYGNNAFIAPEASVTDGKLDVVIMKSGNVMQMLLAGFDLISGMVPYNAHIDTLRGSKVRIECLGEACTHLDGEPIDIGQSADIECLPHQLRIYAPPSEKPITPFITPIDLTLRDWGIALGRLFK
ncbi:MAG: diacylglycerol kinase family lipid kinase [Bacteroidales bacterium]|nr:diacylglycerol kinase family lipid kinase [Bacteroidales bacterium]